MASSHEIPSNDDDPLFPGVPVTPPVPPVLVAQILLAPPVPPVPPPVVMMIPPVPDKAIVTIADSDSDDEDKYRDLTQQSNVANLARPP